MEPVADGADLRVQDLQVIGAAEPLAQVVGCRERVCGFADFVRNQGAELHLGVEAGLDLCKVPCVKRREEALTSRS